MVKQLLLSMLLVPVAVSAVSFPSVNGVRQYCTPKAKDIFRTGVPVTLGYASEAECKNAKDWAKALSVVALYAAAASYLGARSEVKTAKNMLVYAAVPNLSNNGELHGVPAKISQLVSRPETGAEAFQEMMATYITYVVIARAARLIHNQVKQPATKAEAVAAEFAKQEAAA